jgi:hypothetical protein
MHATCLANLTLLELICLMISADEYKLWSCNFLHSPVTSSVLELAGPQVADGADVLQIWRVAANTLNQQ